eukprot:Nk52_evm105s221 gene=Nk52_evmTU105s221
MTDCIYDDIDYYRGQADEEESDYGNPSDLDDDLDCLEPSAKSPGGGPALKTPENFGGYEFDSVSVLRDLDSSSAKGSEASSRKMTPMAEVEPMMAQRVLEQNKKAHEPYSNQTQAPKDYSSDIYSAPDMDSEAAKVAESDSESDSLYDDALPIPHSPKQEKNHNFGETAAIVGGAGALGAAAGGMAISSSGDTNAVGQEGSMLLQDDVVTPAQSSVNHSRASSFARAASSGEDSELPFNVANPYNHTKDVLVARQNKSLPYGNEGIGSQQSKSISSAIDVIYKRHLRPYYEWCTERNEVMVVAADDKTKMAHFQLWDGLISLPVFQSFAYDKLAEIFHRVLGKHDSNELKYVLSVEIPTQEVNSLVKGCNIRIEVVGGESGITSSDCLTAISNQRVIIEEQIIKGFFTYAVTDFDMLMDPSEHLSHVVECMHDDTLEVYLAWKKSAKAENKFWERTTSAYLKRIFLWNVLKSLHGCSDVPDECLCPVFYNMLNTESTTMTTNTTTSYILHTEIPAFYIIQMFHSSSVGMRAEIPNAGYHFKGDCAVANSFLDKHLSQQSPTVMQVLLRECYSKQENRKSTMWAIPENAITHSEKEENSRNGAVAAAAGLVGAAAVGGAVAASSLAGDSTSAVKNGLESDVGERAPLSRHSSYGSGVKSSHSRTHSVSSSVSSRSRVPGSAAAAAVVGAAAGLGAAAGAGIASLASGKSSSPTVSESGKHESMRSSVGNEYQQWAAADPVSQSYNIAPESNLFQASAVAATAVNHSRNGSVSSASYRAGKSDYVYSDADEYLYDEIGELDAPKFTEMSGKPVPVGEVDTNDHPRKLNISKYVVPSQSTPLAMRVQTPPQTNPAYNVLLKTKAGVLMKQGKMLTSWPKRIIVADAVVFTILIPRKKEAMELERQIPMKDIVGLSTAKSETNSHTADAFEIEYVSDSKKISKCTFKVETERHATAWIKILASCCLLQAVTDTLGDRVRDFVRKGADVNAVSESEGRPLIAMAIWRGMAQEATYLLKHGAHPHFLLNKEMVDAIGFKLLYSFLVSNSPDLNFCSHDDYRNTLLHYSVMMGSDKGVAQLLTRNVHLNYVNGNGDAPIHIALKKRRYSIALMLIMSEHKLDVNMADKHGDTPLHLALKLGREAEEIVRQLEMLGADLNAVSNTGKSPIHLAIETDCVATASFLIKCGCDINVADTEGDQPLHLALRRQNKWLPVCETLVAKGAYVHTADSQNRTAMHIALEAGYINLLKKMIEIDFSSGCRGINHKDPYGQTILFMAAERRDHGLMRFLLEAKADSSILNKEGENPLQAYLRCRDTEIRGEALSENEEAILCDLLAKALESKINLHSKSRNLRKTILHDAVPFGMLYFVRDLVTADASLASLKDANGDTPLHIALKLGDMNMIKLLQSLSVSLSDTDADYNTPLHLAVMNNNEVLADFLLKHNADPYQYNKDGNCPLHIAIEKGVVEMIELFIDYRIDLNIRTEHFKTPLMVAVECGKAEIIKLLIKAGADPTLCLQGSRMNCLHLAAHKNRRNCVAALMLMNNQKSVDGPPSSFARMKDANGRTPAQLTSDSAIRELIEPSK